MSFDIKKLNSGDVNFAKQLIYFFQIDDGIENPILPSDEYVHRMLSKPDFYVIIALEGETLIGGLTAYEMPMYKRETTEMFLYEIGVETAYRQKGVATALIEFLKEICLEKGIVEMFVGTSKDNIAARKLYKTTGGEADEDSVWFSYKFELSKD